ncbi:hypothetical protein KI387_037808, partial [Taxus chinensis]
MVPGLIISHMRHIEQRPLGARGLRDVQLQLVGPSQAGGERQDRDQQADKQRE